MVKTNKCTICGTKYEYCGHCDSNNVNNMWRNLYCSENCRDIYDICGKFVAQKYSIEEAYNLLKALNIPNIILPNGVKNNVAEIMAYGNSVVTAPVKEEIIVNEPMQDLSLAETPTEDVVSEETFTEEYVKPRRSRRRFMPNTEE